MSNEVVIGVLKTLVCTLLLVQAFAFEGLLHAAGEVRKDRPRVPLKFASPNWRVYHRTDILEQSVLSLVEQCEKAIHARVVEHPLLHVSLSESPKSTREMAKRLLRSRTKLVFVFGLHGRDMVTSEVALRIVEAVCTTNETRRTQLAPLVHAARTLLPTAEIVLVPIANPSGRRIAEMGRRCEKTNANDVDIDRNWDHFWRHPSQLRTTWSNIEQSNQQSRSTQQTSSMLLEAVSRRSSKLASMVEPFDPESALTDTTSRQASVQTVVDDSLDQDQQLAGTHPFSEPETQALRDIVKKVKPTSYVSVRSGALAMTYPWDCKTSNTLRPADSSRLENVLAGLTASHCQRCSTGSLWNVTGRTQCGTSADYVYGKLKVPFVHTWHMYWDSRAATGDCFRSHNPTTPEAYERVINNWAQAVFNFTAAVHTWHTLERSKGISVAASNASETAAHAAEYRAQAIAKGMPDPEDDPVGDETDLQRIAHGPAHGDTAASSSSGSAPRFSLISLLFGGRRSDAASTGSADGHENEDGASGGLNNAATDFSLIMSSWFGVFVALLVFAAGLHAARKVVLPKRGYRSRLRPLIPLKSA